MNRRALEKHLSIVLGSRLERQRLFGKRIGDADRDLPLEQFFDQPADHLGSPALSERGRLVGFELAQVVGDQLAHVIGRSHQAGRHLGVAADAGQGGREELSQHVQLRAGVLTNDAWAVGVRQVERF